MYTRLCKSLETGVNVSRLTFPVTCLEKQVNGEGEERIECSSTATMVDDYAGIDDQQIDSLILDARKAATKEKDKSSSHKRKRPSTSDSDLEDDDDDLKHQLAERESKARRDKILMDAELQRAQLLKPGECNLKHLIYDAQARNLGSHVDRATELLIMRGVLSNCTHCCRDAVTNILGQKDQPSLWAAVMMVNLASFKMMTAKS